MRGAAPGVSGSHAGISSGRIARRASAAAEASGRSPARSRTASAAATAPRAARSAVCQWVASDAAARCSVRECRARRKSFIRAPVSMPTGQAVRAQRVAGAGVDGLVAVGVQQFLQDR